MAIMAVIVAKWKRNIRCAWRVMVFVSFTYFDCCPEEARRALLFAGCLGSSFFDQDSACENVSWK